MLTRSNQHTFEDTGGGNHSKPFPPPAFRITALKQQTNEVTENWSRNSLRTKGTQGCAPTWGLWEPGNPVPGCACVCVLGFAPAAGRATA